MEKRSRLLADADELADALYDRQVYEAGAAWDHEFFQAPMGCMGKTEADTNMYLSGQLPKGNRFMATGIEMIFLPAQGLSKAKRIADVNAAARSGLVRMCIGNRQYFMAAPLAAVPARAYWYQDRKDETEKAVTRMNLRAQLTEQFRETDYGAFGGKPFDLVPVFIDAGQSFRVIVSKLAPLPSGEDGELWCRINGRLIRDIR